MNISIIREEVYTVHLPASISFLTAAVSPVAAAWTSGGMPRAILLSFKMSAEDLSFRAPLLSLDILPATVGRLPLGDF